MTRLFARSVVALPALGALFLTEAGLAASLQTNVSYGATGAVMNVYVPDRVDASPGIVVSLHYCGGNAAGAASWFTGLADQYGFIVIAPGLPSGDADGCWDVGSTQTRTHNGGSHSRAITQMVTYAITTYRADATRVFAAGASSGAMMTNVLLGAYPDVFAAGSLLAGVPFGCWTVADGWDNACAGGTTKKTAQQWGDLVRGGYPGYTGRRPRVQLFHGTSDTTLNYANLAEEVKQWTNVFGISETPTSTQMNTPKSGWTRTSYGASAELQVSIGQGVAHDLTGQGFFPDVIRFFGLDQDAAGGMGGMGGMGGTSAGGRGGSGGTGGSGGPMTGGVGGAAGGIGGGTGGVSQGGSPTGGTAGAVSGAGGMPSGGGGGSSNVGGATPTGGVTATGGTPSGGTSGGGTPSGGGSGPTTGGASGSPSNAGSTSDSEPESSSESGCGCRLTSQEEHGRRTASEVFGVLAAGLMMARRRRRRA